MSEPLPLTDEPQKGFPKTWIILGVLVVVHTVLGAYSLLMSRTQVEGDANIGFLAIGFQVSQPLLLAIWASMGSQRFYHRFLSSFFLCTLMSFVEDAARLRNRTDDLGHWMLGSVIIFVLATGVLLAFRRLSRWQIVRPGAKAVCVDYQPNQFGIKHLLILTTITALACGLCRTLVMLNPGPSDESLSAAQIVAAILMFVMLLIPVLVVPWYTLACHKRVLSLLAVTLLVTGACDVAGGLMALCAMPGSNLSLVLGDLARPYLLIQLGAGASILLTTLVIRWCGFRMIRESKP